jgi:hypothetical protein
MAYVHAKKADEPSKEVRQITEIRRMIVSAKPVAEDAVQPDDFPHTVVEPRVVRTAMAAEPDPWLSPAAGLIG